VRPISLPDVPYGATAVRPNWADLPEGLRRAISARLGSPVVAARSAGGGFTHAFAAILTTADDRNVFLKAAPLKDPTSEWYAREGWITSLLPAEVVAPRPLWSIAEAGHFALCLEAVDGHVPAMPWSPTELEASLAAWSAAAEALARPSAELLACGIPSLPDILRTEMSWWSEIAGGREPMPRTAIDTIAPGRLDELAELEQAAVALTAGPGVMHGDLRIDNVLIDGTGRARLCDWTWPCLGAPWFDTVTLLVTAYASGLDADAYLQGWNAPAEGVDGVLAALAGYWLMRADDEPTNASPHSRQHQLFSGRQALAWLADRRGWQP
jgi:aminoglycoside phosphotransferase (APT) family kinase protein